MRKESCDVPGDEKLTKGEEIESEEVKPTVAGGADASGGRSKGGFLKEVICKQVPAGNKEVSLVKICCVTVTTGE